MAPAAAGAFAYVKGHMIRWARERHNLSIDDAAKKVPVKPEKWAAWEAGTAFPTTAQAQTVANCLYIPYGLLYLPSPPEDNLPLPDLRTRTDRSPVEASATLRDLVNDITYKQQWYRSLRREENGEVYPFVGKYPIDAPRDDVANDIRLTLGINSELREHSNSVDQYMKCLVENAEMAGIVVMRSGVVRGNNSRPLNRDEFQGFAISDQFAPLIFINAKDLKVVQVFTFAHEIAHIWFGLSGISNPDFRVPDPVDERGAERACNNIAAEVLVPRQDLLRHWNHNVDADANIQSMTRRYWVSRMVLLRRASDTQAINRTEYSRLYRMYSARTSDAATSIKKSSGGDYYATLMVRNSVRFTSSVLSSLAADRVSTLDAARLLDVKARTLDNVATHLYSRAESA